MCKSKWFKFIVQIWKGYIRLPCTFPNEGAYRGNKHSEQCKMIKILNKTRIVRIVSFQTSLRRSLDPRHYTSRPSFQMSDVGCRMSDVGCRISNVGCQISDAGCWMSDLGCRMSDVRSRMSDVGCRISGVGCRMSDVESRMAPIRRGHWDFRFCGFGYFLDRFFGFCCKRLRFFGFGGHCGLRIFRFLASGFRFSWKILAVFRFWYPMWCVRKQGSEWGS